MASIYETGHAKNIANFQSLIAFVSAFGESYNPSKDSLKISQLNIIVNTAQTKLSDVIEKKTNYNNSINERVIAFSTLKSLSTSSSAKSSN